MANPTKVQQIGNQLVVIFDDGTREYAVPTMGGTWMITGNSGTGPGPGPGPAGELKDWWTPVYGISGDWEDHASYSRGGTDWPLGMNTALKAPAAGTIVNLPNVDAAGLKTMLVFDISYPRKIAASDTLMNGVYVENDTAPAVAMMFQHLSSQVPERHVNMGDVIAYSGNSAGPGDTGDIHLHAHLLAGASVGADRLDFRKFV